jgi:hypothetical protein
MAWLSETAEAVGVWFWPICLVGSWARGLCIVGNGASGGIRTHGPLIKSQLLCQLSYGRIKKYKKFTNSANENLYELL